MATPATVIRKARFALTQAIERVAYWTGEAQWKHGWRCGANDRLSPEDQDKYYRQEQDIWKRIGTEERDLKAALSAYTRALRKQAVASGRAPHADRKPAGSSRRRRSQ